MKKYWFIITTVVACSVAWGQTTNKVNTLEEAVKSNSEVHQQITDLKANQERLDERTRSIQKNQEQMLEIMLRNDKKQK